jgi:hypothetical protein
MLEGMSGIRVSVQRPRWRFSVGGVFDIVQLPLIGLKLAGVISWPWSMVLLPLWFFLGSLFIIGLGIAVAVVGKRVALLVQDRRSGERVALLMPDRREDHTC